METLDKAKKGKKYKIIDFSGGADGVKRRLWELGFTRGQIVKIVEFSPLKKVFLLELRGYLLSVKAETLSCVVVG